MKKNIIIKEAALQDADILRDLCEETFRDTYGPDNTEANMKLYVSENFSRTRVIEELKDPHSKTYLALLDDVLIGYMKLNLQKGILDSIDKNTGMEIARIYVKRSFQRNSAGSTLFEKAIEVARKYNERYIWLGVWEKNPKAIKFYEKMGFHHAGHHLFQLGDDLQSDIIMRMDL